MHPTWDSEFSRNRARLSGDPPSPYEPELGSLPESGLGPGKRETTTDTGTTIVGLTTPDGVVLAADRRASLGGRVVSNKNVQKIAEIQPNAGLCISGSVGGAQAFIRTLRAEANLYEARRGEYMSIGALSTIASNMLRAGPYFIVVPLMGGVDAEGSHVYSLDPSGSSLADYYSAQGSGMPYALGVLEQEYEEGLSLDDAVTVAAHAVESAVERDTASGNGLTIGEVTTEAVEITNYESFDELL